jgi:hypothetical protein
VYTSSLSARCSFCWEANVVIGFGMTLCNCWETTVPSAPAQLVGMAHTPTEYGLNGMADVGGIG